MRHLPLWLMLAACQPATTRETVTEGTACGKIDAVLFEFDTCLSSSCDTVLSSSCTATFSGDTITVTATAEIESTGGDCTADCGFATVECPMPEITDPAGVTVVVGDQTIPLENFECGV